MMNELPKKKDVRMSVDVVILCFLFAIFLTLVSFYFYRKYSATIQKTSSQSEIITSPTPPLPTPRRIPHGKKKFTVGQGDKSIPQFGVGYINPYDPAVGSMQSIVISVKHTQPITSVTARITTDHLESAPYALKLIKGTNLNGEWQGSWKVTDSYLYTYIITFEAKSSSSTATVPITLR